MLLPALFTLGNLVCGCLAIGAALLAADQEATALFGTPAAALMIGAAAILLGMLCDVLDGLMARLARCSSEFGALLDTLADMVTFGVAPAALLLGWGVTAAATGEGRGLPFPVAGSAGFFAACAALRLARFHATAQGMRANGMFIGLPTPAAAALVVATLLLVLREEPHPAAFGKWALVLPGVALLAGVLMVSRLPYPHLMRVFGGRDGWAARWVLALPLLFTWYSASAALLACAAAYAGLGLLPRRTSANSDQDSASSEALIHPSDAASQPH